MTAEANYQGGKGCCYEISRGLHVVEFQFPHYKTEGCLRMLTRRGNSQDQGLA